MSIRQLDQIGEALGQAEGWLYDAYVAECFTDGKIHWKQMKTFLVRCVDLERDDLIADVLSLLMEKRVHTHDVFLLAETLFAEGKWKASIPFYQFVCETEIKQHSERLAISKYKEFRARLEVDLKVNFEAAAQFAPFRARLAEHHQLDALLQLANVYFTLHQWEDVVQMADEMRALVLILLHQQSERVRRGLDKGTRLPTERHLVVYFGQSYMLKGNALVWMERYEEALPYIAQYEDLSWFEDLDETGWQEVKRFALFAEGNRYDLHMLLGHVERVPEYVSFLDKNPAEWLPGFLTIITAANRFRFEVDEVILHYMEQLEALQQPQVLESHAYYRTSSSLHRYTHLCCQLAAYELERERYRSGMDWLLQGMTHSMSTNNRNLMLTCMAYMDKYRHKADPEHLSMYECMMKEVIEDAKTPHVSLAGYDSW